MLRGGVFRAAAAGGRRQVAGAAPMPRTQGVTVRRFAWVILGMTVAVAMAAAVVDFERNPARRHPPASIAATGAQHIIVKLRPAAGAQPAEEGGARSHLAALATRTGLTLEGYRSITADMHVMQVSSAGGGGSAQEALARLRADPEVQYAELDQRRFIHKVPDDTLYPANAASYFGQWYLMPSSATTPSAIDAQTAWNTTTGSANLVIADIDTGVRFDHPDLLTVVSGGRLLPGYCFITDPNIANGACPGSDASDTGDAVTQADLNLTECIDSGVTQTSYSSWHGTRVAGVLGAITNNAQGVAGVTWSGQILPVRALGVCGGQDSDIISGMLWAAGISTGLPDGVAPPANPNPAKIINMSLGGSGSCPQSYQDVIDQVTALGVLVVVSAGNETGPVDAPANCAGVAGVAGLRHVGTKVGYSNVGPGLAVAAPAGNCVNTTASDTVPCLYPINSTTNLGIQGPVTPSAGGDYTGLYSCGPSSTVATCQTTSTEYRTTNLGTSFSAPQVAGIGALMLAVNAKLNSCQLISRLQEGALPFPQTSAGETPQPPMCPSVNSGGECICTNDGQTCGAGMANAKGAVAAALRPIAAVVVPSSVTAGQVVQLKGSGSAASTNHTLTTFGWASTGGQSLTIQNANTGTASVTVPSCGLSTVTLTVTDNAGLEDTAQVVVSPTAVTTTAPAMAGQTSCSNAAPAIQVAVCPASAAVQAGRTETLTATLANTTDTNVTWEVNGIDGGDSTVGTISSSGVYSAPSGVPQGGAVTITAVSNADGTSMGTAQLTITAAPSSGGGGGGGGLEGLTLLVISAALVRRYRGRGRTL